MKHNGMLRKQIEIGLGGLVDAVLDGSIAYGPDGLRRDAQRVFVPAN